MEFEGNFHDLKINLMVQKHRQNNRGVMFKSRWRAPKDDVNWRFDPLEDTTGASIQNIVEATKKTLV